MVYIRFLIVSLAIICILDGTKGITHGPHPENDEILIGSPDDVSTHSNTGQVKTNHLSLEAFVNFEYKILEAQVIHHFVSLIDDLKWVTLDLQAIEIDQVHFRTDDESVWHPVYDQSEETLYPSLGMAFIINLDDVAHGSIHNGD